MKIEVFLENYEFFKDKVVGLKVGHNSINGVIAVVNPRTNCIVFHVADTDVRMIINVNDISMIMYKDEVDV